jgi:zinc protease
LSLALRYTADRLRVNTSLITDSVIEKHRRNVLNEIQRQESKAFYSATISSLRERGTFGKDHPYGHSAYGSVEENKFFTKENVIAWYKQYFFPDNIILFITGNFRINETRKLISHQFGNINPGRHRINLFKYPEKISLASEKIVAPIPENYIGITWRLPGYCSPDNAALELLAVILDNRMKNEKNISASIKDQGAIQLFKLYKYGGSFGLYASFSSAEDSLEVEKYLYQSLNNILINKISGAEIDAGKKEITESIQSEQKKLAFIGSRNELLGEGLFFCKNPDSYFERIKKQLLLTENDIKKSGKKYLSKKGSRLLVTKI